MTIARCAAEVLEGHVTLELECFDRLYLNGYVPLLQGGAGAAHFFRDVRGNRSSTKNVSTLTAEQKRNLSII